MIDKLSRAMDYDYAITEAKRKACRDYIKNNGTIDVLKLVVPGVQDLDRIFEIRGERISVKLDLFAALLNYPEELVIPDFVTEVI